VRIQAAEPVLTFDVLDRDEAGRVRFHYVIVDLAARFVGGEVRAGDDALEARWVSRRAIGDLVVNQMTRKLLKERFAFP